MSVRDIDGHKLAYHPEHVAYWKLTGKSYPLHIEAGITNRCNHKCIQCTLDWINHKQDNIDEAVFLRTLDNAADIGVKSIYFAGEGEPTLHPSLIKFAQRAHEKGIKVAISTNGSLMKNALAYALIPYLSWIRFSVDAATPQTYSVIHGVSQETWIEVWSNIQNFIRVNRELNGKVSVGVQTLLMPENVMEIEYLAKISKEIGADNIQVKPAHCHPNSSYKGGLYKYTQAELSQRLEKLTDDKFTAIVRLQSMERLIVARTYRRCHAFDFYCLIDALGNVTPCNIFYGRNDFIFGNINEQTIQEIWDSAKRQEIIEKITNMNHCNCKEYRCRQDILNRYLERVKNAEINDEFI